MNYSLPEAVRHHVDFVLPTVHFDVHTTPHAPTQEEKRDPAVPSPGKLKDKSPVLPKQGATLSPQALAPAGDLSKCDQQACLPHFFDYFAMPHVFTSSRLRPIVSGPCTASRYACIGIGRFHPSC
jgi:hypothetical protein